MREAKIATNDRAGFEEFFRALGGPNRAVIKPCWGWGKVHDRLEAIEQIEEVALRLSSKKSVTALGVAGGKVPVPCKAWKTASFTHSASSERAQ